MVQSQAETAKGYQFYRQKIIGNYIVDFYCHGAKLVIELDGGQHYTEERLKRDKIRDDYLRDHGLSVLRFSDREVFENLTRVVERIYENLQNPPDPLCQRGKTTSSFC